MYQILMNVAMVFDIENGRKVSGLRGKHDGG